YRRFISNIFTTRHYSLYERVLDFDQAVQLLVEQQKFLQFNSFRQFKDLQASHLLSFGMI
ncbi:hypothetical protein BDR06DRAFT_859903, partial [Suillus hirtellus]